MFNFAKLEQLCKERNVTLYTVAKETNIDKQTLYSWQKSEYTPKADKIKKIADYFGVSIEYFM